MQASGLAGPFWRGPPPGDTLLLPMKILSDGRRLVVVGLLAVAGSSLAQQSTDSGSVTLQATVSGYVDIASGGAATLNNASGGTITGNTNKGDPLTGITINFGDVSPLNPNAFVRAIVPIRLRSNVAYTLTVSSSGFSNPDPEGIQPADIGFGIDATPSRADPGVRPGTDTVTTAMTGDPSLDPDANLTTAHWDYAAEKSLAYLATPRVALTGPRIMQAVPRGLPSGLTFNTYFVIKPQFFSAPGSFTTQVTYTISTP